MRKTVIFSLVVLLFAACKKDKYQTTPQLKFENVNTTVLARNETLRFTLSFTDAEGDLTDQIFIQKVEPNCTNSFFTAGYPLPTFPSGKNQKGEVTVTFSYNDVSPKCFPRNDTAIFKFILRDKAQNTSDTAVSPAIVILQ
ncbi:MAG: hypothetical protein ABIR81_06550 [Ginsengibacter sp.]